MLKVEHPIMMQKIERKLDTWYSTRREDDTGRGAWGIHLKLSYEPLTKAFK